MASTADRGPNTGVLTALSEGVLDWVLVKRDRTESQAQGPYFLCSLKGGFVIMCRDRNIFDLSPVMVWDVFPNFLLAS
jgi:hypothetical protein